MGNIMESNKRIGSRVMIISMLSMIVWLVLSDGYDPRLGFLGSFYYLMTFYEGSWFCKDVNYIFGQTYPDCWNISIKTKYLVLLSTILGGYGFMVYKGIVGSPSPSLKRLYSRIKDELTKKRSL